MSLFLLTNFLELCLYMTNVMNRVNLMLLMNDPANVECACQHIYSWRFLVYMQKAIAEYRLHDLKKVFNW